MPRPTSAYVTAVVVAVLALAAGAASQALAPTAAPGPSADCGSALTGLAGCLAYIAPGSQQSKPPKECCTGVKSALSSPATVSCLCDAFGKNYGFSINLTRAAGLPAACGGDPAALSKCHTPSASSGSTPGSPKSAVTRSPISATVVLAAVAAPLLSYYFL